MSLASALGSIFAPGHEQAANQVSANITNAIAPGSAYWQQGNLGALGTTYENQAAGLMNAPISVDTSGIQTDAQKLGQLQSLYAGLAAGGGPVEQATLHQAQANLANTSQAGLLAQESASDNTVGSTATAERGMAGAASNSLTAEQLQDQLKMALLKATVTHANLQAHIAGQGVQNTLANTAYNLGESLKQGAQGASNAQRGLNNSLYNDEFGNAMTAGQAILGGVSQGAAGVASNFAADTGATADSGTSVDTSQANVGGGTGDSAGYTLTSPATSLLATPTSYPQASQTAAYANPFGTGTTMPSDASAWLSYANLNNNLVS